LLALWTLLLPACTLARQSGGQSGGANQPLFHDLKSGVATAVVDIYVHGPGGSSLAGQATVQVKNISGQVFTQGVTKAGYLRLNSLLPTEYTVSVVAPGYELAVKTLDLSSGNVKSLTIELKPLDPEDSGFAARLATLSPKAQKELAKASEALRSNKPVDARSHLEAAKRESANHPEVTYLFGIFASQMNEWSQAKTYWRKTIELYPKHLRALISLSEALLKERNPTEALPYSTRAVAAEPSSWRAHAVLAETYLLLGSRDQAIQEAQRAIDLGHGEASMMQPILSRALAERGDKEPATQVLSNYVHNQPADAAAKKQLESLQNARPVIDTSATTSEIVSLAANGVQAEPSSWRAHAILAEAYLLQGQHTQAITEAQRAQELGHEQAAALQLLIARAYAQDGDFNRSAGLLADYLKDHPSDAAAQKQLADLQHPTVLIASDGASASDLAARAATADASALPVASNWLPPDVDERVPPVDAAPACSVDDVVDKTGKELMKLVSDVDRFTATESLTHQSIDKLGMPSAPEKRKFEYVVSIQEVSRGFLNVDEYRSERGTQSREFFPDGVETNGLPALVLIFHPYNAKNFEMTCEGQTNWNGNRVWQVHFRQRKDHPNTIRSYKTGKGVVYPVALKGRAWISADTHQIVRLESDLVAKIPEIRLLADHSVIEYGPVKFRDQKTEMWLPQTAEVYYDWKGKRFHRVHSFSNFLLYSVDEKQRITVPKVDADASSSPPDAALQD